MGGGRREREREREREGEGEKGREEVVEERGEREGVSTSELEEGKWWMACLRERDIESSIYLNNFINIRK